MSTTQITIERVNEVEHHPNADRLDIVQVLGYKCVTGRDQFKVGDTVVYFPPDMMIGPDASDELGVANYLKHSAFPGFEENIKCRIGACRLRGVPSHGIVTSIQGSRAQAIWDTNPTKETYGHDVTSLYGGLKYIAPVRVGAGDSEAELTTFPMYTNIENIQRYPYAIPHGEKVVITEKIHGTNCRMGLVRIQTEWEYVAGSHRHRRQEFNDKGERTYYWRFMDENMKALLNYASHYISGETKAHDVVLYGEIYGPGVQDMDYGETKHAFRAFDLSLNGEYVDYVIFEDVCEQFNIPTVPVLYFGPFSNEIVEQYTYGDTTLGAPKCKFNGREGVVVKPVHEQFSSVLGKRMILKSVSADYKDRRGATDME